MTSTHVLISRQPGVTCPRTTLQHSHSQVQARAPKPLARSPRSLAARRMASATVAELPTRQFPATVAPVEPELQRRARELGAELIPLHKNFGVQVKGWDFTQPLDEAQQGLLLVAWRTHDMLLLRGQELPPAAQQHILEIFPHDKAAIRDEDFCNFFFQPRVPSNPLLSVKGQNVDLDEHHGIPREELQKLGLEGGVRMTRRLWHMDLSDVYPMPEVSAMYMVITPPKGGETVFASMATAYDNLDAETQRLVRGLKMVNAFKGSEFTGAMTLSDDGTRRTDDIDDAVEVAKEKAMFPYQEFEPVPFVIQDEDTGRLSLLASVQRMHHFVSHNGKHHMSRKDSLDLLERILKAACADSEVYDLKWQPDDFALWSNRRLIHSTTPAQEYEGETRLLHLVFLDCDPNKPLVAAPSD